MNNQILLSIITPAYCDKDKVQGFINSILAQNCDLKVIEFILINDCSPFDWRAGEFTNVLEKSGLGNVVLLDNKNNLGRSKTRNKGIQHAQGMALFFVDVDNYLFENACQNILDELPDNYMARINIRMNSYKCHLGYQRYFDNRYLGARNISHGTHIDSRFCASDGLIIPAKIIKKLSGFDEDFSHYGCEDEELGIRAEKHNIPLVFFADVKAIDTDNPTLARAIKRMTEYSTYSFPLLYTKHPSKKERGLFPFAEKYLLKKQTLLKYFPWSILIELLCLLELGIKTLKIQPPNLLYKMILGLAYLKGGVVRR